METVEDISLVNPTIDIVNKLNEKIEATVDKEESNVGQETNGNLSSSSTDNANQVVEVNSENVGDENNYEQVDNTNTLNNVPNQIESEIVTESKLDEDVNNVQTINQLPVMLPDLNEEMIVTVVVDESDVTLHNNEVETSVEVSNTEMTSLNDEVKFQTEVLVEQQENDERNNIHNHEIDSTNSILNDLSNNIEFSEALHSSDVNEVIIDNNSNNTKEEVFNKEELLDILQGNDVEPITSEEQITNNKMIEAQIALKQLNRLQIKKSKTSSYPKVKKPERKINEKKESDLSDDKVSDKIQPKKRRSSSNQRVKKESKTTSNEKKVESDKETDANSEKNEADKIDEQIEVDSPAKKVKVDEIKKKPEENIVNVLVQDWDDDEAVQGDSSLDPNQSDQVMEESKILLKDSEELKETQKQIINPDELMNQSSQDSTASEDQTQSSEKGQDGEPPRRISRVIKKKVIFDPDNPDTFTKSKTPAKVKEIKDTQEQNLVKKVKVEPNVPRSKSKSPSSKMQWKKPSIKNSKQCKRLSEVDRLLMDEGAVNMIYQLTPEAPKGKKNMRTKAEFIKKIQSSTPDGNEMKFRERKKESLRYEDGEARKILGGKHRSSLSSSVKSPAVSEDFETHSADDSIIYRRHSSSSYSSSCMSPRRLSDVDGIGISNSHTAQLNSENTLKSGSNLRKQEGDSSVFMSDSQLNTPGEIINKNDCLSIKEKLNSKLNLALNKRKRENMKADKPSSKHKKFSKDENSQSNYQFKDISVNIEKRLAVVTVNKSDVKIKDEVIKELAEALNFINTREDISVTLLTSQCAALCSNLQFSILLDENKEAQTAKANELAESLRALWSAAARHSKWVCVGVGGRCQGAGVALAALADAALAAEGASFAMGLSLPAAAALGSPWRALPHSLVNELVVFGRRISASEALKGGLISRTVWPERFDEQIYNMAKDIAAQPLQTTLLKKKLLNLKRSGEVDSLLSCLEAERDLLVEYWTSVEGQEILRATLQAA